MFKNALSLTGAVVSLFMIGTQAGAVTVAATGNDVAAANTSYIASVSNNAGPAFTNTFDFTYGSPYVTSLSLLNGFTGGVLGIPAGVTYTLLKEAGINDTVVSSNTVAPGVTSIFNFGALATGLYHLVFTGTAAVPFSVYAFQLDVGAAAPSPTPLPGALALLASVLFGGFGFAKLRRRRLATGLA
jgi:hypothetical protein